MSKRPLTTLIGTLLLCVFAFPMTGNAQHRRKPKSRPILSTPTVAFCELVSHPQRYDKRVVRTEAISAIGIESAVLYDPQCSTEETRAWVTYDSAWSKTDQKLRTAYNNLLSDENNGRIPRGHSGRARAVLVGRFEASDKNGYGHLNQYRFQFVIMNLEKVEKVGEDIPYWP
jgi:hypothetical protein